MTLNPTNTPVSTTYLQQLTTLLDTPNITLLSELTELNSQEEDIPHSSNADSRYLLIFLTLLFAKSVTLNDLTNAISTTSQAYNHMYDTEKIQPNLRTTNKTKD